MKIFKVILERFQPLLNEYLVALHANVLHPVRVPLVFVFRVTQVPFAIPDVCFSFADDFLLLRIKALRADTREPWILPGDRLVDHQFATTIMNSYAVVIEGGILNVPVDGLQCGFGVVDEMLAWIPVQEWIGG